MKKFVKIKGTLGVFKVLAEVKGRALVKPNNFEPFECAVSKFESEVFCITFVQARDLFKSGKFKTINHEKRNKSIN
jgi:hypothetical protein